jgi:multiple sugar transport system substrate-binding protein
MSRIAEEEKMRQNPLRLFILAPLLILSVAACSPAPKGTVTEAAKKNIKGQAVEALLPPWAQLPQGMLDAFAKDTGATVTQTIAQWDAIRDKISVAGAAGSPLADVAEFDWSWTGQFSKAGWFIPLENVIDKGVQADLQNTPSFTADGHLYAIPYSNDFRISAYNTAMFTKAGIAKPPATFDELRKDLATLKAKGVSRNPLGLFMAPNENTSTTWFLLTIAMGGDLFDKDLKPAFTDPASGGYRALQFMVDMNKEGFVAPGAFSPDTSWDTKFMAGETAFHFATGPALLAVANDPKQSSIVGKAAFTLVVGDAAPAATFGLPEGLGIMTKSKRPAAAAAFIEWWMRPENVLAIASTLGLLPTRTSVMEGMIKDNKLLDGDVIIAQAKLIKPIFPAGTPPWYSRFSVEAATLLNSALKGDMSVKDALNKLADKAVQVQSGK